MRRTVLVVVAVVCCCAALAAADTYAYINEGEVKCFFEDVPKDTLVVSTYTFVREDSAGQRDDSEGPQVMVEVTDPEEQVVLSKTTDAAGRIAFTSAVAGEYTVCFKTDTSRWYGGGAKLRFYLEMNTGSHAKDYAHIAKLEHLNAVDVKIGPLNDMTAEVRAEQKYLKLREHHWRDLSEAVHSSVVWWAIAQLIILFCSGVFQMRYLKNFFKTKKLV